MVNERGRGFVFLSEGEKREEMCDMTADKINIDEWKRLEAFGTKLEMHWFRQPITRLTLYFLSQNHFKSIHT